MSQQILLSVDRTIELFLGSRAYGIISESDELYKALTTIPEAERQFVLENSEWSVAFDTTSLPQLQAGLYRLWNKQDWTTSNNKHIAAVTKANADHKERERMRAYRKHRVRLNMINAQMLIGANEDMATMVVDMMLESCSDEQIASFYNGLSKENQ
jgi:hypothetical protein